MKNSLIAVTSIVFLNYGMIKAQNVSEIELKNLPSTESKSLALMEGLSYKVLFSEFDVVLNKNGDTSKAKGWQDLVIYLPTNNSSTDGQLFVGHETAHTDDKLGHGGGATIMSVKNDKGWKVVREKQNVDFSTVGYTMRDCGGHVSPKGTILMAEETYPLSSMELIGQIIHADEPISDTLYQNFGWMVEVDPTTKKAIRKLTAMGRYSHEDAICLPDNKTVILTNDESPAILFKFVADIEKDYTTGTLYAYSETGKHWLELPRDLESLKNSRQVAIKLGATLFVRHEWATQVGDDIYISETGHDLMEWQNDVKNGGKPASYFEKNKISDSTYIDLFGRILKLNTKTWEITPLLEGGFFGENECFSNPDCLSHFTNNGKNYLVISEDVIGLIGGRVSKKALRKNDLYCEVYLLDLDIKSPTRNDLIRIASAPRGSETTGLYFTPDQKTLFMVIQHPDTRNKPPFDKHCVLAITGF